MQLSHVGARNTSTQPWSAAVQSMCKQESWKQVGLKPGIQIEFVSFNEFVEENNLKLYEKAKQGCHMISIVGKSQSMAYYKTDWAKQQKLQCASQLPNKRKTPNETAEYTLTREIGFLMLPVPTMPWYTQIAECWTCDCGLRTILWSIGENGVWGKMGMWGGAFLYSQNHIMKNNNKLLKFLNQYLCKE